MKKQKQKEAGAREVPILKVTYQCKIMVQNYKEAIAKYQEEMAVSTTTKKSTINYKTSRPSAAYSM